MGAPGTIDTVPEKALLTFADHGGPVELLAPDYAAAGACVAGVVAAGVDVDALGQSLERQGARAFEADWAGLLEALGAKAGVLVGD